MDFEKVRTDLIKFIVDEGSNRFIYTNLQDEILGERVGEALDAAYDFEDYRLKVNRYIENNKDHLAIHKLRNNLTLTGSDYESLEHILTGELGTAEDYEREFQDTPFGLLVRKIAKLEHDAAMKAFSAFISDQSLSQAQIVFVSKIIDYIAENGYIEATSVLMKPPFDRPQSFIKLFDGTKQKQLVEIVNAVRENAVRVVG